MPPKGGCRPVLGVMGCPGLDLCRNPWAAGDLQRVKLQLLPSQNSFCAGGPRLLVRSDVSWSSSHGASTPGGCSSLCPPPQGASPQGAWGWPAILGGKGSGR